MEMEKKNLKPLLPIKPSALIFGIEHHLVNLYFGSNYQLSILVGLCKPLLLDNVINTRLKCS